jgi:GGDEF domain-containing protein
VSGRADVDEIARRLEHCFDDPLSIDGFLLQGSASVGLAIYPEDGVTGDSLLKAADAAMYQAKNQKIRERRVHLLKTQA